MTHQHQYFGGYCIHCLKKQPIYRNGKEVGLSDTSDIKTSYKRPQARRKKIHSEFQYFVDELMTFLKEDVYKKGNFSKYCGVVKKFGTFQINIWIKEMKRRGISSPKYFWGIIRNNNKSLKN